jgi:hypothetical protein
VNGDERRDALAKVIDLTRVLVAHNDPLVVGSSRKEVQRRVRS